MKLREFEKILYDYKIVELVGINEESNYNDFITNKETSYDSFGDIIVVRGAITGKYYELVTGVQIPIAEMAMELNWGVGEIVFVPQCPYRGNNEYVSVTRSLIDSYIKINDNDNFRNELIDFINNSKSIKNRHSGNTFVKKLSRLAKSIYRK